jgi:hypothetical protein
VGATEATDALVSEHAVGALTCGSAIGQRSAEHQGQGDPPPLAARRADALIALARGDGPTSSEIVVVIDTTGAAHSATAGTAPATSSTAAPATTPGGTGPAPTDNAASAHIHGGPSIPLRTAERIGCNARVRALLRDQRGNPLHLGRSRRLASPAQLAALRIRDQGCCRFPGCESRQHLEAHHIVHWLRGGRTDIDNLVLICGHHHRLIHDHGYRTGGRGTDVRFHRPDGRLIDRAGTLLGGSLDQLLIRNADTPITDETITPTWLGEPLDLDAALVTLLPEWHPTAASRKAASRNASQQAA